MRQTIIAGNWKMHNDRAAAKELVSGLQDVLAQVGDNREVILCPPYTDLETATTLTSKLAHVSVYAQNMFYEEKGAFTGEIAPSMLRELGVKGSIIGHSERRGYFGETNLDTNKKIKTALGHKLRPILCVGENEDQRVNGVMKPWIQMQILEGLQGLSGEDVASIVIAYEPLWAIGTGRTATVEQAQKVCQYIRQVLADTYSKEIADKTPILYGGSVKAANAKDILQQADIDGVLVGGASLKVDEFSQIIKA